MAVRKRERDFGAEARISASAPGVLFCFPKGRAMGLLVSIKQVARHPINPPFTNRLHKALTLFENWRRASSPAHAAVVYLRGCFQTLARAAVGYGLGQMDAAHLFRPVNIGQGSRHFEDTVIAPGGKIHGFSRFAQKGCAGTV